MAGEYKVGVDPDYLDQLEECVQLILDASSWNDHGKSWVVDNAKMKKALDNARGFSGEWW